MSTVNNNFILSSVINHMPNSNKKLSTCFVDYTKAFDLIVRETIWYKLIKLGLRGNILNIIKSFYLQLKSSVKCNTTISDTFLCTLGVAQGDYLSPFFYHYVYKRFGRNTNVKGPPMHRYTHVKTIRSPLC